MKKAVDDIQQEESNYTGDKRQLIQVAATAPKAVKKQPSFMSKVPFVLLQFE